MILEFTIHKFYMEISPCIENTRINKFCIKLDTSYTYCIHTSFILNNAHTHKHTVYTLKTNKFSYIYKCICPFMFYKHFLQITIMS